MHTTGQTLVISILLPDRIGILAQATETLYKLGGDIGAIRQSIVGGFFSLTLIARFCDNKPDLSCSLEAVLREKLGDGAAVIVRDAARTPPAVLPDGERFIAITRGKDRPGLIYEISSFFLKNSVNILNWQVDFVGTEVTYIAAVIMPPGIGTVAIQKDFIRQMELLGVSATLAHENIFRATNEIGPIASLLPSGKMRPEEP